MKTKPIQRVMSVIALMALALTTLVVPAFAAGPSATAQLNDEDRTVLADGTNVFEVTVNNTEPTPNVLGQGGGENIDAVIFTVSSAFATLGIESVNSPSGWNAPKPLGDNRVLVTASGDGIAPGDSETFSINSTLAKPDRDKVGRFQVSVSSNGGQSASSASEAFDNALKSNLRILEIDAIRLVRGTVENQEAVTDGQTNVDVEIDVSNVGSGAVTVLPELLETGDGRVVIENAPAAAPVPADGSTTFVYDVTFERTNGADINTTTLDAVIDSSVADAEIAEDLRPAVDIEKALALTYVDDTLAPQDVAAALTDVTLDLQKSGVPAADSLTLSATFTKGNDSIVPAADTVASVGRNGDTLSPVTFIDVPFDTPGLTDGAFNVNLSASGTDANGAAIDLTSIPVADTIFLDTLAPILTITDFDSPESQVEGEEDAATNGQSFQLVGNVKDRGAACPECGVTATFRIGTQDATAIVIDVDSNGEFDQAIPVENAVVGKQDTTAKLTVTATDVAGTASGSQTRTGSVDTQIPDLPITAPLTGGLAQFIGEDEDLNRIDVLFPEGIAAGQETSALNWSFQNGSGSDNPVTGAEIRSAEAVQGGSLLVDDNETPSNPDDDRYLTFSADDTIWFVQLTIQNELDGNDEGTVTYEPNSRVGVGLGEATNTTRIFDRVDLGLPFGAQEIIDNVAPDLPIIGAVQDLAKQTDDDGVEKFFTNAEDGKFNVTVTNLQPGTFVDLFKREADGSETKIRESSQPASTNEVTFADVEVGRTERTFELYAVARDNGLKISEGESVLTVLDRTAPVIDSATFDGMDTIRVVTNEGLVGTDRAFDWYANATDENDDPVTIFVNEVAKADDTESFDLRERDLTLDTTTYDPSAGGTATLDTLVYDYQGTDNELTDRAGNFFADGDATPVQNSGGSGGAPAPAPGTPARNEEQESSSTVGEVVTGLVGS